MFDMCCVLCQTLANVFIKSIYTTLTRPEGTGGKTRRCMVPQTACCQNNLVSRSALPTDSHSVNHPPPTSLGSDELKLNKADLRMDHHLWGDWAFIKTSLFLTLNWHFASLVGFISSHLTADKLYPVNPRPITGPLKMSLLLEVKSMPSLIIKPRPCCAPWWPWLVQNV